MGNLVRKIDYRLLAPAGFLIVAGLLTLASSGGDLLIKQLVWIVPALLLMLGLPYVNVRAILSYRWVIYGAYLLGVVLLVITYLVADPASGPRSWIDLGLLQVQPSELMKAALILFFSSFFAPRHVAIAHPSTIFLSFLYLLVPFSLVLIQPDLGTALILFGIWFGYLLLSGIKVKHLAAALLIIAVVGILAWNFGLAGYQKARITALFAPEADPLGINYSVIQSKVAIGSGGLFGKGFGQGTQAQLGFLPAAHTDFVFSTFTEEWGLAGGLMVISAFLYLIYRLLALGAGASSNFTRFITLGTALLLIAHFAINLGSATGLLPVIGVGLPLMSYGGSNLLTVALMLGIIQSVADQRFMG